MEYKVLYLNDNGTAKVQMTVDGSILEQDFDQGADEAEFDANVKQGMAVFKSELTANAPQDVYQPPVDTTVSVKVADLPTIPPEDNLPPSDNQES